MRINESRFSTQVRPCTPGRCGTLVIRCITTSGDLWVDAIPSPEGNIRLADTGGSIPVARRLTTANQFGMQGTLHRVHTATCTAKAQGGPR